MAASTTVDWMSREATAQTSAAQTMGVRLSRAAIGWPLRSFPAPDAGFKGGQKYVLARLRLGEQPAAGGEAVGTSYIRHNLLVAAILSSLGFSSGSNSARVCGSTHPNRLSSTGPQTPQPHLPQAQDPHTEARQPQYYLFFPIRCALCLCTADACKAHKRVTWVLAWCKGGCKDGIRGYRPTQPTHSVHNNRQTRCFCVWYFFFFEFFLFSVFWQVFF